MNHDDITASLPITVPYELHRDIADATSEPFAISYLTGAAVLGAGILRPRTYIARERLLGSEAARRVLDRHNITVGASFTRREREPIAAITKLIEAHDLTGKWRPSKAERS